MKKRNPAVAHMLAMGVSVVWGMTFVASKVLLEKFSPVELLLYRFAIGFVALLLIKPKLLKFQGWKREGLMALGGLTGVTLYFLGENFGLEYTLASNVSVIVSVAPMMTAIIMTFTLKEDKMRPGLIIGFIVAIFGIVLISYNGSFVLKLNPLGDLLGLCAAISWAVYSIILRKVGSWGLNTIQVTRRVFMYGVIFTIPVAIATGFRFDFQRFADLTTVGNMLYLGLIASALCYVVWNYCIDTLGAVKTSVYIYAIPVVTVLGSALILKEPMSPMLIIGTALALAGLAISELKIKRKQ